MLKNRINLILELLAKNKVLEVTELSEALGVSQVTVRKDLDKLEKQGVIIRKHGSAQIASPDDITGRIAYHYENKRIIAKKAVELVEDGETIMIENGSCCALFSDELAKSRENITIITNSAFIAEYVRNKSDFEIILLGGILQKNSQVIVGPMVKECIKSFNVDKFFIGTDGYTIENGFTNKDPMRTQAVKDMAEQANNVIILTESEKFSAVGVVQMGLKDHIEMVITDKKIEKKYLDSLKSQNIKVLTV